MTCRFFIPALIKNNSICAVGNEDLRASNRKYGCNRLKLHNVANAMRSCLMPTAPPERPRTWIKFLPANWNVALLLVVLVAALAVGLYGRFVGLGVWAFGVDEFYISRSIDNVLRTGLPKFLCGGFYTRGLTYQYVVALVRHFSVSPEYAGRVVSAVWSLVGLPAAYVIGRRLGGRTLGLMMVIILSASVWEIEMARFARMYAPYQSIFLWYLVFFLRYTVDRDRSALVPMVLLSIFGVFTWEGGAILGVANCYRRY